MHSHTYKCLRTHTCIIISPGAGAYIVEALKRSGADNDMVAKYGLKAAFYFTIEEVNMRSMHFLGIVAVVLDLLRIYNTSARFDAAVMSSGLVTMSNLLYDGEVQRMYGRVAARVAVQVLRQALGKRDRDRLLQQLESDALTLLGSAARLHMSAHQMKFLCKNIASKSGGDADGDGDACIICMDAPANLLFIP